MGKKLPLRVTIDTIDIKGFGADQSNTITAPNAPITLYNGGPLYCHATGDATAITITIDEVKPSSFVQVGGPITTVIVKFRPPGAPPGPPVRWTTVGAGNMYDPALPIIHKLVFTPPPPLPAPAPPPTADLSKATIHIEQLSGPDDTKNSLGIIVLGHQITGGNPEGYFVNVPMAIGNTVDPTEFSAMSISWTPDTAVAGPIGGGQIP